jgi:hypothetical protein
MEVQVQVGFKFNYKSNFNFKISRMKTKEMKNERKAHFLNQSFIPFINHFVSMNRSVTDT